MSSCKCGKKLLSVNREGLLTTLACPEHKEGDVKHEGYRVFEPHEEIYKEHTEK